MKKIILTIAFIATGMVASAQVGIGNENPQVTLQVDASGTDADGVLVPRVSVDALNAKDAKYIAAQNGALVFVNDLTGTAAGKTSNVIATGFYYYDSVAEKWVAMKANAAAKPVRVATASSPLTNDDLNGYIICTAASGTATFSFGTILNPKKGDTITITDAGGGDVTCSGLASGSAVAPANSNGGGISFVYSGSGWYHTSRY